MSDPSSAPSIADFYERWSDLYTSLSRHAPGVRRLRRRTIDELELEATATVVDMGCGPGGNLGYIREEVGSSGTVIGIDVAPAMLERAARVDPRAALILGDGSRPPLRGPVDALLATFAVTLFDDPEVVIDEWWSLLGDGGRLGLLDLGVMRGPAGRLANPVLRAGLAVSTPGKTRFDDDLLTVLEDRVTDAHDALTDRAATISYYDSADGLFRVAVGAKAPAD